MAYENTMQGQDVPAVLHSALENGMAAHPGVSKLHKYDCASMIKSDTECASDLSSGHTLMQT